MAGSFDPKKPRVAALEPKAVELEKGAYFWCACGHSKKQPFCDGSHTAYEIRPVRFATEQAIDVNICMCKHTRTPPYCDGTHLLLDMAGVQVGEQVSDEKLRLALHPMKGPK